MLSLILKIAMTAEVIGIPLGFITAYIGIRMGKDNVEDIGYLIATISILLIVISMVILIIQAIWR
jgi:hypothetical protein